MTAPVPPSAHPLPDGGGGPDAGPDAGGFEVRLEQQDLYRFLALFDQEGVEPLTIDEPAPLGEGAGPNASRLLATAVGHCLSASALFCLSKARIPVHGVRTTVTGEYERNERGRLRIGGLKVHVQLDVDDADRPRMSRCMSLFEDFCVVTASVRDGVEVDVEVGTGASPGDLDG